MTIQEALNSDKAILSAPEVASLLDTHPHTLNLMARNGELPFPFIQIGSRTKVPRLALLRWLGAIGGEENEADIH